jgi:hypothetical protein
MAKKQNIYKKLQAIKMYQDNLDIYISIFNNLAKEARYLFDTAATVYTVCLSGALNQHYFRRF